MMGFFPIQQSRGYLFLSHSFSKHLFSSYFVGGPALSTGSESMSKTVQGPLFSRKKHMSKCIEGEAGRG